MIRGCVPKKLLVYGSRYGADFADAKAFGWSCEDLRFDWPTLIHNVRREVDRLNGVYARILDTAGVDKFLTRATLESPHEIKLADRDQALSAKTILVATGGHPMIPDLPGKEHLISSNECFELEQLPASIAIIGAGYIGMEFASIFNGLGVAVTVLYRGDQILRDFDMELRDGLAEAMRNRGVDLRMNADIASIEQDGTRLPRSPHARRFGGGRSRHGGHGTRAQHHGAGLAAGRESSSAGTAAWWSTSSRKARWTISMPWAT